MKRCIRCKKRKRLSQYHKRGKGTQSYCKACNCSVRKLAYKQDRSVDLAWKTSRRAALKAVVNIRKADGCKDCGLMDSEVLEFDHVRGKKLAGISSMVLNCVSLDILQVELAKCEVVCANCHRRRTSKRRCG